ncbi:hypothetical protein N331_01598, partial [Merops nubicus]
LIPLADVRAEWEKSSGPLHKQRVAQHCGIFRDLFKGATFIPWVALRVEYSQEDEDLVPVYYGNVVTPSEASSPPAVSYEADKGSLWTLLLTNPGGHLRDTDSEYLHWLVESPGTAGSGMGFHCGTSMTFSGAPAVTFSTLVFWVLLSHSLKLRTFSTFDFYRKHEDAMTPAGLAFFPHMREPVFEFVRPPVYHPPQVKFPRQQPLRYLDRYRDSEEPTYGIY